MQIDISLRLSASLLHNSRIICINYLLAVSLLALLMHHGNHIVSKLMRCTKCTSNCTAIFKSNSLVSSHTHQSHRHVNDWFRFRQFFVVRFSRWKGRKKKWIVKTISSLYFSTSPQVNMYHETNLIFKTIKQ